jgi:hypothetical protein
VFGSDYNLTITADTVMIDTVNVSASGTAAQYNLTGILGGVSANTISIDTVTYANFVLTGTSADLTGVLDGVAMTIDVSTFNVANVIGSAYNDMIIMSPIPGMATGGDGDADQFDFSNNVQLDATTTTSVTVAMAYAIADFGAGNTFGEKIFTGSDTFDIAHYAEKTQNADHTAVTTFEQAAQAALDAMSDPTLQADIVSVKLGGDVYVFVDQDGNDDIDLIIQLVGVDINKLNFADFGS